VTDATGEVKRPFAQSSGSAVVDYLPA